MPLSEHEQRLLEQMEQAMYAEDPKFASAMRGRSSKARQRRRFLLGGIVLIVGLGLVVLGVARPLLPVAVAGFVLMLAGAAYAAAPERKSAPSAPADQARPARRGRFGRGPAAESLLARLEQRWDRRRDNGWGA